MSSPVVGHVNLLDCTSTGSTVEKGSLFLLDVRRVPNRLNEGTDSTGGPGNLDEPSQATSPTVDIIDTNHTLYKNTLIS